MTGRTKKTDTQIHRDVLDELKWDSRVDETEVGIEIDDGVVTLTGTVAKNWGKRMAAEDAARRVIGVLDVANDIKVAVPTAGPTDTEIARRCLMRSSGTCSSLTRESRRVYRTDV